MAFTVEGKDGTKITAGTIEGLRLVLEELSETPEETSVPSEEESPLPTSEQLKEGDTVRILTEPGNYMFGEFHRHVKGSIGTVTEVFSENSLEVEAPSSAKPSEIITQMHRPSRLERVESLGKDANGEDLFEGDYVTGASGNGYLYTDDSVVMKVILKEDATGYGINADIGVEIVGDRVDSIDSYEVKSERFIRLSGDLDEAKSKFSEIIGEEVPEEDDLLPVGTKVRLLRDSACEDLRKGEEGTITGTDRDCRAGLVYKVRVRDGWRGYGWISKDDVEVVEEEPFKVGDKVKVTGNSACHDVEVGDIRKIHNVDSEEPKYRLSGASLGSWANTKDLELVTGSEEPEDGDIVKVTATFEDDHGDEVVVGTICEYEDWGGSTIFIGTVLLGHNHDKIQLVCRKEDRKDIKL